MLQYTHYYVNIKTMEENTFENKEVIIKNNNQMPIVSAIIIAGVLIAGAILLKGSSDRNEAYTGVDPRNNQQNFGEIRPVSPDEHIIGNSNAKVVIVEYSDLECPFCKVFHNTMHQIVDNNNGDVAWVFRHYPIPSLHQKAMNEAVATECAWEQGGNEAFWKYTDKLFEVTTSNDGLDEKELPKIAKEVGLDVTAFTACLSSGKFVAKVEADINDGLHVGVDGTPASYILVNGKIVNTIAGAEPLASVQQKIDAALK